MRRVLHWFRRDLRVSDNTALSAATARAEEVVPVFVLEAAFRTGRDVGAARAAFLLESLEALRKNLESMGYPLVIRTGSSDVEIPKLAVELGAEAVFANRRYEPYAQARDSRVFNGLNRSGIGFELFKDAVCWEEREILTGAGNPFTVFTPYSKAWKARRFPPPKPRLARRSRGPSVPARAVVAGTRAPTVSDLGLELRQSVTAAGERAGLKLLEAFLAGPVYAYGQARDFPGIEGTSRLSPHLRCGTVGIRTVLERLGKARESAPNAEGTKGCDVFLTELIWREFYLQVLSNFPHVMRGAFRPGYDRLRWSENRAHFQAWCDGQTGYPIVDAAMRCLNRTGWMHNRLRMIVAMFLTKDLLLPWQWGERYFMQQLVDGDLAANNGGWQWSAGTGTDAAPYFRIFNPVSQGEKFDGEGVFVRRWVPELGHVSAEVIHRPWELPSAERASGYPNRVVLHEEQRPKCLAMFAEVKGTGAGRA